MPELPARVQRLLSERRGLLWVAQRYDLATGEEPHGYDVPPTELVLRYRSEMTPLDKAIAQQYWEAAWFEGVKSPVLDALRSAADQQPSDQRRSIVILASEDDARTSVSSQEFFPIVVLPGVLDTSAPAAWRYGSVRGRAREWTARLLASRLELYQSRVLVVIGARKPDDLAVLYEILEDRPIPNLDLVLVWPLSEQAPRPANSAVDLHVWPGTEQDLVDQFAKAGIPRADQVPEWSVRLGPKVVDLRAPDVARISERFTLLTDHDLQRPDRVRLQDLTDFLDGSLENWTGFAAGVQVSRSYVTDQNASLEQEVIGNLQRLQSDDSNILTLSVQLPAESGAGATTLLRGTAFAAASAGYPTLVLRPDQVEPDLEDVLSFATQVQELALTEGLDTVPPILVVLDVEHTRARTSGQIASVLSSHGRRALVLQAIAEESVQDGPRRTRRLVRLPTLKSAVTGAEVHGLRSSMSKLVSEWGLAIEVPSEDQWEAYARASRWTGTADSSPTSLFWVALRFFLTEGMPLEHATSIRESLGGWIARRANRILDAASQSILTYVSALSSFRIVAPVWSVIRPVTGGSYSSELSAALKELGTIVRWEGPVSDLDDYVLRFSHPVLAEEYLRQQAGVATIPGRLGVLQPVLRALSAGHTADVWLAEQMAANVLAPLFDERQSAGWEWRLSAFDHIPPAVADQSKTIQHHWARCLYLSADVRNSPGLLDEDRLARIRLAIEKLTRATQLPRRAGRDEHPSHLYNTLGTAYFRLARLLEQSDADAHAVETAWRGAWRAFEQSIELSGGSNVEALLAFSQRLLSHARDVRSSASRSDRVSDVLQAIDLLEEAEELVIDHPSPDPEWQAQVIQSRAQALSWLDDSAGMQYVDTLKRSADPELGFLCEARIVLGRAPDSADAVEEALTVIANAENSGVTLGARTLRLKLALLGRSRTLQFDFQQLLQTHVRLERAEDYSFRPVDLFRHGVLCYQVGQYAEGSERFRRLREYLRREGFFPLRFQDFWREGDRPEHARITQARVTRVITDWRADAYISDFDQTIPIRPRHFAPPPHQGEVVRCAIRFEMNGPLAVPPRFMERRQTQARDSNRRKY